MHNSIARVHWLLLLMLTTLINARPDESLVYSGNYEIRKCNAGQPSSMASHLQRILPMVWSNLQMTIADAKKGTQSSHGYAALFKTNSNIREVQGVYQDMAAGRPVDKTNAVLSSPGRHVDPLNRAHPGFVCIQDEDPSSAANYLACQTNTAAGGMIAAVGAQYILLCPNFWRLLLLPDSRLCPKVRRNTLTPNDARLVLNAQSMLMHELAHLYGVGGGGGSRGFHWQTGEYEPYLLQETVDVSAGNSTNNAQNFAFFYAANVAGCTSWPKMAQPHDEFRHMLEYAAPGNMSAAASSLPIAPDAAATQPVDSIEVTNALIP